MSGSGFVFGARSKRCLIGVHPHLVTLAEYALAASAVDFGIHCGLRTEEQQAVLVRTGKSLTMNSRHLTGHAIDCHPWVNGQIPWHDWDYWEVMALAFTVASDELGIPIEWGGKWARLVDGPHFQLPRDKYPANERVAA